MEFENELRKLRWTMAPSGLRSRVLRDAVRTRVVAPWFDALEHHWLYPGRAPTLALIMAWLVIASFRFTTPAALLPGTGPLTHLSEDDLARLESQRAQLFAELGRWDDEEASPPREPLEQPGGLPPRS